MFDRLGGAAEGPATTGQLVDSAKKLALQWPSLRSDELKDLLASFVRRVIIQENKIDILLSRADLRQVLQKGDRFVPTPLDRPLKSVDAEDLICLAIEAKLKRSGGDPHRAGRRSSSRLRQRADGARTAKQQVPTHPLVRAHAGL